MKKIHILAAAILFFTLAFLLDDYSYLLSNKAGYAKKFEKILAEKIRLTDSYIDQLQNTDSGKLIDIINKSRTEGIIILRFRSDSLEFWSSNRIPVDSVRDIPDSARIVTFFNSYYYIRSDEKDSVKFVSLINLYHIYPYDNEFLRSGFEPDFKIALDATMGFSQDTGFPVHDRDGSYLFSIRLPEVVEIGKTGQYFAAILFFLGIFLTGIFIYRHLKDQSRKGVKSVYILMVPSGLLVIRILQLLFSLNFNGFLLFNPYLYGESALVPSLGDLLINSLLIFFIAAVLTRLVKTDNYTGKGFQPDSVFGIISLTVIFMLFFLYAHYYSYSLIFNSSISFQPGALERLSLNSLLGFFINGLNYLSAGLVLLWFLRNAFGKVSIERFIPVYILTTAVCFSIAYLLFSYPVDILSLIFFYVFSVLAGGLIFLKKDITAYSFQVLFLLLFSVYSFIFNTVRMEEKESVTNRSVVLSLANEHDPIAEYLFDDLTRQIKSDPYLTELFDRELIDVDALHDYLQKNYFTGFWTKYDLQITLCRPYDSVLIEVPEFQWFHCYNFFDQIVEEIGFSIPDTRFYYLDNLTGRISYLGKFPFDRSRDRTEISLFIELDSKLSNNFLGYPELLLDKILQEDRLIQTYSYAKYYRGDLVSKYGDFSYSLTADLFGEHEGEYNTVVLDGYKHLLYRSEEDSLIILSVPQIRFFDLLVGFSYIFLFYYLCLLIITGIRNLSNTQFRLLVRLRSKIQFSILTILLISLILIAITTVWLNLRNYRQNQLENLQEKVQSVLIELSHKLAGEEQLTRDWNTSGYDNLDQLLIKFSDVFYTDINLYTLDGNILASSRYEIFDLGLQGDRMDPVAYYKLNSEKRAQFIHREKIGNLQFLSAYVPFENAEGLELAYLNLPYFTKQAQLQTSLSTLIITIVNIYVILILITIVITILISEQITRPLEILQSRFRELKIGNKYEQILYKREDEIGSLVNEYNNMVLELEHSVNLLARSERESAWREMAKQIAHEIKNPLTPMRLSIQQLNRMWTDKREDFEKSLQTVTATLIEQIDNLSSIASEFSNFAKMPAAKFENVELIGILEKAVQLFEGNRSVRLHLTKDADQYIVRADKEQLSRVFINLIKNGIQSIPEERAGKIDIHVGHDDEEVVLSFKDNGRGIPDEVKPKLFIPNFTTKSSGMGLGLAITKNVIDQMGGKIEFQTQLEEGTEFILILPLHLE